MSKSKIPQMKTNLVAVGVCLCLTSACQRTTERQPAASEPVTAHPPRTDKNPRLNANSDAAFVLRYDMQDAYPQKAWHFFDIVVEAEGQWHLNKEFPTTLTVLNPPDEVTFRKTTLGPADAIAFSEPKFHFQVPFMASAGDYPIQAKLAFAVCTPQTCVPEERTVELSLHVTK